MTTFIYYFGAWAFAIMSARSVFALIDIIEGARK
jgi:hypothetical protein